MPEFQFKTAFQTFFIDVSEGKPKVEDIQKKLKKLGYRPIAGDGKWDTLKYISKGKELSINNKGFLINEDYKSGDGLYAYIAGVAPYIDGVELPSSLAPMASTASTLPETQGCSGEFNSLVICYPPDTINFHQFRQMMREAGAVFYSTHGNDGAGVFRELTKVDMRSEKRLPTHVKAVITPLSPDGFGAWRHGKRKSKKQTTLRHKKRSRSLSSKSPKRRQRKKRTMSKRRQRR